MKTIRFSFENTLMSATPNKLTHEIIDREWEADSVVDTTRLGDESSRNPVIHAKYISYLTSTKIRHRKAISSLLMLKADKMRYYKGEMTKQELDDRGWPQYQGIKPLKSEMDGILQVDRDMITQEDRVAYLAAMVAQLESILKAINSRTWDIRNSIEWVKIQNGIN